MATKAKKTTAKSTAKSTKGGARPGAGRKPKAITEMRETLISPLAETGPPDLAARKSAAEYALDLFVTTMQDVGKDLGLRLDCAKEVMNRTMGRSRIADATMGAEGEDASGGITIFIPHNGRDERETG